MGEKKVNIPFLFQDQHYGDQQIKAKGLYKAERSKNPFLYLLSFGISIPITKQPKTFFLQIDRGEKHDTWNRLFDGHLFKTKMYNYVDHLKETQGAFAFEFDLQPIDDQIVEYHFRAFKFLGIHIPKSISIQPSARVEITDESEWNFEVQIHFLGRLMLRYWGKARLLES